MNYSVLANELQQPQYAGLTDQEAADALNAANIPVRRRVPISELQARAMESGVYTALRVAVANAATPVELQAVCQTVLDLANARFADVDLDNPASQQMFGALTQAGVITSQQAAAIDALATTAVISRAQQLGLGIVTVTDIQRCRIYPQLDPLRVRAAAAYNAVVAMLDEVTTVPDWPDLVTVFEVS